ncbi:MAG TPA: choice-of-anchor Q domain-containing protein [Solirubrobacteraceae bacterium]|jgi:hypothetical protein|nr:choice-of-anchor Q domain-containing protein [Solirubrobacteraceae bacterium]
MGAFRIRGLVGLVAALALLALPAVAQATVWTVTTNLDPAAPVCPSASNCSLRGAVADSAAGDTVMLPAQAGGTEYEISTAGAIFINHTLTIEGAGAATTTIEGVSDGPVQLFALCNAAPGGSCATGAIPADITIEDVTLDHGWSATTPGGAVENDAQTTLVDDVVRGGIACQGAGLANLAGNLTVSASEIDSGEDDCPPYEGGAVYDASGAALDVVNSTIDQNAAADGGGIYDDGGTVMLANSTIADNESTPANGGTESGEGGGLVVASGTTTVQDSILADNCSEYSGVSAGCAPENCSGTITSLGDNIDDGTTCGFDASTDRPPDTAPQLVGTAPADNGGPTPTYALTAASPAIDAGGTSCGGAGVDQRGVERGIPCDIGAYESAKAPEDASVPTVSGMPAVGQQLQCASGGWRDPDSQPLTFVFAWDRDGVPIATGGNYTVQSADLGTTLTCVVTATNAVSSVSARSAPVPLREPPAVTTALGVVAGPTSVTLTGAANTEGQASTYFFQYGSNPDHLVSAPATALTLPASSVPVAVSVTVNGLSPSTRYVFRLVAENGAGATYGTELAFSTPGLPVLGQTVGAAVIKGKVLIEYPVARHHRKGKKASAAAKGRAFVPLTQARNIPVGSILDTDAGTVQLTASTAKHTTTRTLQSGQFTAGLFQVLQPRKRKGLTKLDLVGGPSAARVCSSSGRALASAAKLSSKVLRLLDSDAHGRFQTSGRYSSATVRGTEFQTEDRCEGTLTKVMRGAVAVHDFARRRTIVLHTGQSYLARAPAKPPK